MEAVIHGPYCTCPACHHRRFLATFEVKQTDVIPPPIGPGLLDRVKADLDEHGPYYESP